VLMSGMYVFWVSFLHSNSHSTASWDLRRYDTIPYEGDDDLYRKKDFVCSDLITYLLHLSLKTFHSVRQGRYSTRPLILDL
jgi:hypothetical protein